MTETALFSLKTRILALGAVRAEILPADRIEYDLSFREICKTNACGKYGRSWMCPPHAGEAEALIAEAQGYSTGLVYQTVGELEDSFDIEGMLDAGERHNQMAMQFQREILKLDAHCLHLGAGACQICTRCTVLDQQPCRFPDLAIRSLEAYCINVSKLAEAAHLPYHNGADTVTYFGLLLVNLQGG